MQLSTHAPKAMMHPKQHIIMQQKEGSTQSNLAPEAT